MLKKRDVYRLILGCVLLYSITAVAQLPAASDWRLVKEGDGIQVYTAASQHSEVKYIKVSAVLNGTLQKVHEVFCDIALQKDWVYSTRRAYLIKETDVNHLLYYNETALPWPVSNRDIVIRMTLDEDAVHHTLTIKQAGESADVPVKSGIVRVPHLTGLWQFKESGKGQLHAEYSLDVDPGGALPAWIVNLFAAKGPYQTLINLRDLVNKQL